MARSDTPKRMIPDSVAARLERPAIIKTPLADSDVIARSVPI